MLGFLWLQVIYDMGFSDFILQLVLSRLCCISLAGASDIKVGAVYGDKDV